MTGTIRVSIFVMIFVAASVAAPAQSLADDIRQLVLDYQKLKEEKTILTDMYTAYNLISQGYDQVKSIARGNFTLHQTFLNALLAVSPAVRNYYKVAGIINNEAELVREYQSAERYFQSTGHFAPSELIYFNDLYAGLLSRSLQNLDELVMVMTADQLRMSDAERLTAIDRIDESMTAQLTTLRAFNNANAITDGQRSLINTDIQSLESLYGITH
jgi:Tfp pilus assembly protein PilE